MRIVFVLIFFLTIVINAQSSAYSKKNQIDILVSSIPLTMVKDNGYNLFEDFGLAYKKSWILLKTK